MSTGPSETPIDPMLQLMIGVLEQNPSLSFGLTLTVGGALISGTAVGSAAFWQIQAEHDPLNQTGMRKVFLDSALEAVGSVIESRGELETVYVHLVDSAHFIEASGCLPTDRRAFWRGRLADVQGWTLGSLGEMPSPSLASQYRAALQGLQDRMGAGLDENEPSRPASAPEDSTSEG